MTRRASLLALAAVLAACGSDAEPRTTPEPRLAATVARELAVRSDSVAVSLAAGDACAAKRRAESLRSATIDAVNAGRIPAPLQEELTGSANDLAGRIRCGSPTPANALARARTFSTWLRAHSAAPRESGGRIPYDVGARLLALRDMLETDKTCAAASRHAAQLRSVATAARDRIPRELRGELATRVREAADDLCSDDIVIVGVDADKLGTWLIGHTAGTLRSPDDLRISPAVANGDVVTAVQLPLYDLLTDSNEQSLLRRATPGLRAVYTLTAVDGEIENGGFAQLFFNSTGALTDDAIAGARLVGARPYASLLAAAKALFPGGRIPADRAERERTLERVDEEAMNALDDAWYDLEGADPLDGYLRRYIAAHPRQFLR